MTEPAADRTHDAFRELISARLDEPLALEDEWELSLHLVGCPRCRQFDRDLAEQRRLLRALPAPVVPRDLWARTSAALDRELLRDAQRSPVPQADSAPRASGRLAELATPGTLPSMLMVSLASLTLAVVLLITQLGPSIRLPSEDGIGLPTPFGDAGVALAFVGADAGGLTLYRTRLDETCSAVTGCSGGGAVTARVTFPASFEPDNLALAPRGDRLAIMGSDAQQENVFAVLDVPPLQAADPVDVAPNQGRTPPPSPTSAPASPPVDASLIVVATPSTAGSGATPVIPAVLSVSTILDDVHGVGAPPAWSADGQALAFSALPSDRRHGPDVYVWRVGDERARPITFDHGSYFASWSGTSIVVSRAARVGGVAAAGPPVVTTVAIDLASRVEHVIDAPAIWLPQVDPTNSRAVAWHGRLSWDGARVVPRQGALYLLDWTAGDLLAGDGPRSTPDRGEADPRAGSTATASPTASPGAVPGTPTPAPPVTATPNASPAPTAGVTREPRAAIPTDPPARPPLDRRLMPIDPEHDWLRRPVTDWRVMWSADGRMLGQWIADTSGSVWGQLSVLAIDLHGRIDRHEVMLGATPARRGFNLGANRVAWVAPQVGSVSGELRLRLWHGDEVRDVRVNTVESTGVVAAF